MYLQMQQRIAIQRRIGKDKPLIIIKTQSSACYGAGNPNFSIQHNPAPPIWR